MGSPPWGFQPHGFGPFFFFSLMVAANLSNISSRGCCLEWPKLTEISDFQMDLTADFWGMAPVGVHKASRCWEHERNVTDPGKVCQVSSWDFLDWKMSSALRVFPALTAGALLFVPRGGNSGTPEELPAPRQLFLLLEQPGKIGKKKGHNECKRLVLVGECEQL